MYAETYIKYVLIKVEAFPFNFVHARADLHSHIIPMHSHGTHTQYPIRDIWIRKAKYNHFRVSIMNFPPGQTTTNLNRTRAFSHSSFPSLFMIIFFPPPNSIATKLFIPNYSLKRHRRPVVRISSTLRFEGTLTLRCEKDQKSILTFQHLNAQSFIGTRQLKLKERARGGTYIHKKTL